MKLKVDSEGRVVTKEVNGSLLPIYIHSDGKEVEFDAAHTVATISRLNAENQSHRERAAQFEGKLKSYAGIEDPAAAISALQTIKDLGHKKLVDSGEVDKVKAEVAKVYDSQLSDMQKQLEGLQDSLYQEKVGGAFIRSKFLADKVAVPPDMMLAQFGRHFGIENGGIYGTDAQGNKLYSRTRPGELADVDESLSILIDQYAYKDHILKGTGASGGGAPAGGGNGAGGKRTVTRAQFDAMDQAQKAATAKDSVIVD
jgi:hypothetical protein